MTVSLLDKNKVFFGLIHYILSEQKNVNWLLKTSLIDFTGIYSLLEEKPYARDSIIDDVVDYVTSVKPYHVQFSNYFEHYETAQEVCTVPGNDWIESTIETRFDSVSSKPEINLVFNKIDTTSSSYSSGSIIFVESDNLFYIKQSGKWKKYEHYLKKGNYYAKDTDTFYKYKDNKLVEFTKEEYKEFFNHTRANRLFALGITDLDELKKELNSNFKGITVSGSAFDIENFGYDIFDYDTDDYDSPTISFTYLLANYKEDAFETTRSASVVLLNGSVATFILLPDVTTGKYVYEKVFCKAGEHSFTLPNSALRTVAEKEAGYTIGVYKVSNNIIKQYSDYNIDENIATGNIIDVFNKLKNNEKIYITVERSNSGSNDLTVKRAYIIECSSFIESTSNTLKRTFVDYSVSDDFIYLDIPETDLTSIDKIAVQLVRSTGKSQPITSPTVTNNQLQIPTGLYNFGDKICLTAFNYSYLYDKIYTWEDKYGRSNNVAKLFGEKFLRARYEDDRPSELTVAYPLSAVTIYSNEPDNNTNVLFKDYKNAQTGLYIPEKIKETIFKIETDENGLLVGIGILNKKFFEETDCALVNSEIIHYGSITESQDASTGLTYYILGNLKRGMYGSLLYTGLNTRYYPKKSTHKKGDTIIPYLSEYKFDLENNNFYRSYIVDNDIQTDYICPSGINYSSAIVVTKNKKINLLKDVTLRSKEIVIDSANVVGGYQENIKNKTQLYKTIENSNNKKYTGDFALMINEDIVPFTSIYKNKADNTYHITGFTMPSKYINFNKDDVIYKANECYIYSSIPEEIDIGYSYQDGNSVFTADDEIKRTEQSLIFKDNYNNERFKFTSIDWVESKIASANVYYYKSVNEDNVTTIEEIEYGYIKNNVLYKIDGEIVGYYMFGKLFTIDITVVLDELLVGETIHINIINGDETLEPVGKYFDDFVPHNTFTFTVVPTPSDARVKLYAQYAVKEQVGNSILVYGKTNDTEISSISWNVSKPGYVTKYGSLPYITEDTTISVTLGEYVKLTLNIKPKNATVVFSPEMTVRDWTQDAEYELHALVKYNNNLYNAKVGHTSGSTFDSTLWEKATTSIWVEANTKVNYTVSKSGYRTTEFTNLMTTSITKDINLEDYKYLAKEQDEEIFLAKEDDGTILQDESGPNINN